MNFREAKKACHKVGTSHAQGDALRAMYAEMINERNGFIVPQRFYLHLRTFRTDAQIVEEARSLLRDNNKALEVLLRCEHCESPYDRTLKMRGYEPERLCDLCIVNVRRDRKAAA
jgi:hypothetical protein